MKAQSPDVPAARQLFTELEFTSLLKEFLEEGTEIGETEYREAQLASDVESVLAAFPREVRWRSPSSRQPPPPPSWREDLA